MLQDEPRTVGSVVATRAAANHVLDAAIVRAGWPPGGRARAIDEALDATWVAGISIDDWVEAAGRRLGHHLARG